MSFAHRKTIDNEMLNMITQTKDGGAKVNEAFPLRNDVIPKHSRISTIAILLLSVAPGFMVGTTTFAQNATPSDIHARNGEFFQKGEL